MSSRYRVEVNDKGNFTHVNSSTSCYFENDANINNCYLYIDYVSQPHAINLFKVKYENKDELNYLTE